MKKVIILVIASRGEIYDKIIKYYWIKFIKFINYLKNNLKIFLVFGDDVNTDDFSEIDYNIIKSNTNENYIPGILEKTIFGFKYIDKNFDYDYIFRTNLSSFIYHKNFQEFIKRLPSEKCYSGCKMILSKNDKYYKFIEDKDKDIVYVSGAGTILSEDLVKILVNESSKLNYKVIDDVAIGILLGDKVKVNCNDKVKCIRYSIVRETKMLKEERINYHYKRILNSSQYHIRVCNKKNRNIDVPILKYLADKFYS